MPIEGYKLRPVNPLIAALIAQYGDGLWQVMTFPAYKRRLRGLHIHLHSPCGKVALWLPCDAVTQVWPSH